MRARKLVVALLLVLVASLAMTAVAVADDGDTQASANNLPKLFDPGYLPDPQTTNIPYLAWLGETLRISKCLTFQDERGAPATLSDAQVSSAQAALNVSVSFPGQFFGHDWSGVNEANAGPRFTSTGATGGQVTVPPTIYRNAICWEAEAYSDKPGLWALNLDVRLEVLASLDLFTRSLGVSIGDVNLIRANLLRHQFIAIWLQEQAPVINEVAQKDYPDILQRPNDDGDLLGDPAGDGKFNPPYTSPLYKVFGYVKATVKGTFPLGNDFAGLGRPVVTLPTDWAWLAQHFAVDDTTALGGVPGSASMRWDIHDDVAAGHALTGPADVASHTKASTCFPLGSSLVIDAVDNCLGGLDTGVFSRINGGTWYTVGPFDPLRPDQTLLSDGKLDAGDAPMPQQRVDFFLSPDSIGAFGKADKSTIDDMTNSDDVPHDLYAPFYKAYIPAAPALTTLFSQARSGVSGSFIANNYPGFIDQGVYDYWNTFTQNSRSGTNACKDPQGNKYDTPTGPSQVAVYSDEHGEAFVKFYPYRGLFLAPDENNRCNVKPGLYGTAKITALSLYPDKTPLWEQSNKLSNTIIKTANQLANKTLNCGEKAGSSIEAICWETITDFNGDPMPNVVVKFTKSTASGTLAAESIKKTFPSGDKLDSTGQGIVQTDDQGQFVVLKTDGKGQVAVLITNSDGCTDIVSENVLTRYTDGKPGVKLSFKTDPTNKGAACGPKTENPGEIVGIPAAGTGGAGTTPPTTTTPPATGGSTPPAGGSATSSGTGGTQAVTVSLGGPVIPAATTNTTVAPTIVAKAKLFSVKILQTKLGRFLVVDVKGGSAKTAKVRIQILGKNGHVLKTVFRVVGVNKPVTLKNLKLPAAATSVRTSVTA